MKDLLGGKLKILSDGAGRSIVAACYKSGQQQGNAEIEDLQMLVARLVIAPS